MKYLKIYFFSEFRESQEEKHRIPKINPQISLQIQEQGKYN